GRRRRGEPVPERSRDSPAGNPRAEGGRRAAREAAAGAAADRVCGDGPCRGRKDSRNSGRHRRFAPASGARTPANDAGGDVSDLFEKLEPPVGGLARLRERLAREHERRLPRAIWVGGLISGLAAAAVVAAGPWAWRRRPSARPRAPAAVESAATIV